MVCHRPLMTQREPCPIWHHRWRLHHGSPTRKRCKVGRKGFTLCRLHDRIMVYQRNILSLRSPHQRKSNFVDWWPLRGWPTFVGHPCHPSSGGSWRLGGFTVPVHHEHSTLASRILNELNRVEIKRSVKTITTGAWCLEPQEKRFAHVSFWPAARVDSSMIPDLLSREEARLRWVHEILTVMAR